MTTTTDPKRITPETDRSGKRPRTEYRAEYDGQTIGYYKTFLAAEQALNAYALELIADGLEFSATELDDADPYAPLGDCAICGASAWTTTAAGLLCPSHDAVFAEWEAR